jgi:hypothetical protein
MTETPAGPKVETKRPDAGGPQLRRELARAAATLELSELDTSDAHVGELLEIVFAHGRDRGRPFSVHELHAMDASELPDFPSSPVTGGSEGAQARQRQVRAAQQVNLPHHRCAEQEGGCGCLDKALDQVLDEAEAAA